MKADGAHDLVAAYALGALDDEERQEFDAHLESCESCRGEVDALSEAAVALAYAAEGPSPPAALKERILEAARAERVKVVPLGRRRSVAWIASAAAAACLAVGLGLWATLATDNSPTGKAQRVALQGAVGTLQVSGGGEAVMTVRNLPAPPAGKTYEVWVIHQGSPVPAGLFARGGSKVVVRVEKEVQPGATVAVTVERKGGVSAPTGKPLFHASLPA